MKRIYLLLCSLLLTAGPTAAAYAGVAGGEESAGREAPQEESARPERQTKRYYTFEEFYEKYVGREGYVCVSFGRKMMRLIGERVAASDRALARLVNDLHAIMVVTAERPDETFLRDAATIRQTGFYQSVSSVTEGKQTTECYLLDGGRNRPSRFLLFSHGPQETVVFHVEGYFDVKDISRLSTIRPRSRRADRP